MLGLKYVFIDIWGNDQNEMMFSTCQILYFTMLIVCRKISTKVTSWIIRL
jgi:hypothetical protein